MNDADSILPVLCAWKAEPGRPHVCLQCGLWNILIPLLGTSTQKTKKIPFKIGLLFDNAPGHPRALMGLTMCSEINVVPMAANPTSIL